jgi:hypothetical protein
MVFEPSIAPRTKEAFDQWFEAQTKWDEGHGYDDPAVSSPALQGWFDDMRRVYPPMNGPFALSNEEFDRLDAEAEKRVTDYSIGRSVIYAAFAWSCADEAEKTVRELARRHQLGFYHPGSGEACFPGKQRRFRLNTNNSPSVDYAAWENVWMALNRLHTAKGEFVTLEETRPSGRIVYMQAMYERRGKADGVYWAEAQLVSSDTANAMPQYSRHVAGIGELAALFRDWFVWGQAPDFTLWNDAEVAPPEPSSLNKRKNRLVLALILIALVASVAALIWVIVRDFLR